MWKIHGQGEREAGYQLPAVRVLRRSPDADRVIIAMGSICDVAEEVIDYLTAKGEKVGLVKVRLYRPFAADKLLAAIPDTAKKIAVLDRTKEPGALAEPLHLDVMAAFREAGREGTIIGGRYGLGSKDTPPSSVFAVYEELAKDAPKERFTLGINDDVTYLSLEEKPAPNTAAEGTVECKFWGLGGDGTVGANKNSTKIIGDHTDKYIQAYFQYDSKKTGGVTISHLRFGDKPIRAPYYINKADFVACHNPSYVIKGYKMVNDVKPGGVFMINCQWTPESWITTCPPRRSAISPRTISSCIPSTPSTRPSKLAWASAPTPSFSPPSLLWQACCRRKTR